MKKLISLFFVIALFIGGLEQIAYGHSNQSEHWSEFEAVFFNSWNVMGYQYKTNQFLNTLSEDKKKLIQTLEYATTICIDQFGKDNGGNWKDRIYYEALKKWGVPGIPGDLSAINPKDDETSLSAKNHRTYTHQGWDYDYAQTGNTKYGDLARFSVRKKILIASVNKVFNFGTISDYSGVITGTYSKKSESLAALMYYVHLIGDYLEDVNETDGSVERFNGTSNGKTIPFAVLNPEITPDLFSEIIKHCEIVFEGQKTTRKYNALLSDLNLLASQARAFIGNQDGTIAEGQLDEARSLVNSLLVIMAGYDPQNVSDSHYNYFYQLLMNESFFTDAFPQ